MDGEELVRAVEPGGDALPGGAGRRAQVVDGAGGVPVQERPEAAPRADFRPEYTEKYIQALAGTLQNIYNALKCISTPYYDSQNLYCRNVTVAVPVSATCKRPRALSRADEAVVVQQLGGLR